MCASVKPKRAVFSVFRLFFARFSHGENVHRALDPLFHHRASHAVRFFDVAVIMVIIGVATARTDEFGETVAAFFPREQTASRKFFAQRAVQFPLEHVSHPPFRIARKLMAGIDVAVRDDGKILVARAAGGNPFAQAGTALQIDVEVKEVESLSRLFAL